MQGYPKITIVTVCLNSLPYIEDCIHSVIDQQYPNLEYIIVDGGSTDGTLEVIEKYRDKFNLVIAEPDTGPANALNKAFALSTGEILGWLNSDDKLHSRALFAIANVFETVPEADWIMGYPSWLTPDGNFVDEIYYKNNRFYYSPNYINDNFHMKFARWSKWRFAMGDFSAIQQESVFWRRTLWEKAGSRLNENTIAYDLELWTRFFEHAELYTTNVLLGGFRIHGRQLSMQEPERYRAESQLHVAALKQKLFAEFPSYRIRIFFGGLTKAFYYYNFPVLNALYPRLLKLPPYINYDIRQKQFVLQKNEG